MEDMEESALLEQVRPAARDSRNQRTGERQTTEDLESRLSLTCELVSRVSRSSAGGERSSPPPPGLAP